MDASWKGKIIREYWFGGVDIPAMMKAAALDITPETEFLFDMVEQNRILVISEFLWGFEPFRNVTDEQVKEIEGYLGDHGLYADDLHNFNIMLNAQTGEVKVIDYEQFRNL